MTMGRSRESLVDLKKDPGEMVNLALNPEYETVLKQHRRHLRNGFKSLKIKMQRLMPSLNL